MVASVRTNGVAEHVTERTSPRSVVRRRGTADEIAWITSR
jgi:hypothetical protein